MDIGFSNSKTILPAILKEQRQAFQIYDRGIEREVLKQLTSYIKSPFVVVITGLRRVGKSTLLSQVADRLPSDSYYYVNFEDERLTNFTAQDSEVLHETLIELFGEKKIFLLDEIQNVLQWEKFVRRLSDQGYKFFITGSNASLLSRELGSRLTGRYVAVELFPFSFREFLIFKNHLLPDTKVLTTVERGKLRRLCSEYIGKGGIPDVLKYPKLPVHKTLYNDVLYRDIAARYQIEAVRSLKELAFRLISNPSSLISYNKLKEQLRLGSVNTVKNYVDYMENSWLMFTVSKYAFSVREQQIAAKKMYSIDTGLAKSVGFSFSEDKGRLMENIVFLQLRRRNKEIYYYRTGNNREVDFYLPQERLFLQVTQSLNDLKVRQRELLALEEASSELRGSFEKVVVTDSNKEVVKEGRSKISVMPLYEWLLAS